MSAPEVVLALREMGRDDLADNVAELIDATTEAFDAPDVMFTIASHSERLADRLAAAIERFQEAQP
jgi:hypothetical protein